MKQLLLLILLAASLNATARKDSYNDLVLNYISAYKGLAIDEQHRSGIPAAITLAQGIHETMAGQSELATLANNHFGIKCKQEWAGETFAHDDDAPQECFRKYSKAEDSYKDHSDYLKNSKRYASCFALSTTDYAAWAAELRKCGYATNPQYAQNLIKLIEDFHLQEYTYAAIGKAEPPVFAGAGNPAAIVAMTARADQRLPVEDTQNVPKDWGRVTSQSGLKGFWARKGEVLLEYAIQNNIHYSKLLEINALPDAPLTADRFVYLEKGGNITSTAPVSAPEATVATTPVATGNSSTRDAYVATIKSEKENLKPAVIETPIVKREEAAVQVIEVVKEEVMPVQVVEAVVKEEVPQDAFSKMKAEMDKAVYAPQHKPTANLAASSPQPAIVKDAPPVTSNLYHTVAAGETAFGISKKYGITMKQLTAMNNLDFSAIKTGQKLRVK